MFDSSSQGTAGPSGISPTSTAAAAPVASPRIGVADVHTGNTVIPARWVPRPRCSWGIVRLVMMNSLSSSAYCAVFL